MARYSSYPIEKMSDDWGYDTRNGLPYSGASVQEFIKKCFSEKASTGYFDSSTMTVYLFKDEIDKEEFKDDTTRLDLVVGSFPLSFETTQYRIRVEPDSGNVINATINQDSVNVGMNLIAESRELGEPVWNETGQDIGVRVYVDAYNTGTYEEVFELAQVVLSTSGRLDVDIKPYIPVGTSRVRFYFYATNDTSLSHSVVFNVTLAEMYIEEWGNKWYRALVENGSDTNYQLGGFKIVGTISKTIHIDISTTQSVVASYSRDLGSYEAIEFAYSFTRNEGLDLSNPVSPTGEELPALPTGVYQVKVWLTSGNLSTEDSAIVYNIMYVAAGDEQNARLVVMNNFGKPVNNYDESAHLCDYAVYNATSQYGSPLIEITPYIGTTAGSTLSSQPEIFSETKQELNHNISLVTNSKNLTIRYRITMPDNFQEGVSMVDNSEIFKAEDGVAFYLNTSLRSNGEQDKTIIYNTANNQSVPLNSVEWQRMSWVDGIDGWTEDEFGRRCLKLPARTRLAIPPSAFRFLTGENITFELCYRVANVSDYNENIISIAQNADREDFMGIRIKPTNVTVHSESDKTDFNDTYQGTNIADEETVHLLITVQNSFDNKSGYNLVTGYVNGCKNFQFSYASGTTWANTYASAIFGSDTADLYLYMIRFYGKGLAASGAENNWINSLSTRSEKAFRKNIIQSVLKPSSRQIDYETIKNSGKYNFFVVEMTSGSPKVPSTLYADGGKSNIEMHYGVDENGDSRSRWDWKIYDVETKGQGTTSMNYWLWNMRYRIDKTGSGELLISYYDDPSVIGNVREFHEQIPVARPSVWFDGEGNHPAVQRITAKINFASSMQSHKMGATRAYALLHDAIEDGIMLNEAQVLARQNHLPHPEVAVYQYPAFGFQKTVDALGVPSYEFIGLFTIGPDKGDSPTFGYDLVANDIISLEGVDHTPQMAKFNVPWDEQSFYYVNAKGDGYLAVKDVNNNVIPAFEVGIAKKAKTKIEEQAMPVLESDFRPAYDVIYNNSTLIVPISKSDERWGAETAAEVLENINADIDTFHKLPVDGFGGRLSYGDVEIWIDDEYILYHYEYESQQYVSGYKSNGYYGNRLNLLTDTGIQVSQLSGLTLEEQNELFRQKRRERFIQQAPQYWDMIELVFNYVFLVIFGATDNFAKNQYPYYMGGKWRFRQDDLDTIEDIDNNGGQTKPSDIEFNDSLNGSPYFAGSNSVLWNLVHESLWNDYDSGDNSYPGIRTVGREMIEKMSELANGDNVYDGFIKFFDRYFWSRAQEYFPQSAYNLDAYLKYESAWLTGRRFSVIPLRQSLGDHYSAERLWVRRRALYCLSLFGAGSFGVVAGNYLEKMQFRPFQYGSLEITVAESMYPCVIVGNSDIRPTGRTKSGETYTFESLSGDGNTVYTIQAVDNITKFGNFKSLILGNDDGGVFGLSGKKLREFEMGGDDPEEVTTNVKTLSINTNGLPCLETIDLRNASQLSGTLDLSKCNRVKEVYTEGTKISAVTLPRGSKVEKLHLSDYVTTLSYQIVKYLSELILPADSSNITLLYLEECDALDSLSTLETVYNSNDQRLSFIKLLWGGNKNVTGKQIMMLVNIMNNKDKLGERHDYNGVDLTGSGDVNINPILEGTITANSTYYLSDILSLSTQGDPIDSPAGNGIKRITAGYFGQLYVDFIPGNTHEFIEFVGPAERAAFVSGFDSNGDGGILRSEAAAVTNAQFGSFSQRYLINNTSITSLDDLVYFTGLTQSSYAGGSSTDTKTAISYLPNVTSITLPGPFEFPAYSLRSCPKLRTWHLNGAIDAHYNATFVNSPALFQYVYLKNISHWLNSSVNSAYTSYTTPTHLYLNDELVTSINISSASSIRSLCFYRCVDLTSITLPSGVTSIGSYAFAYCTGLTSLTINRETPPTLSTSALTGTSAELKIYVPASAVDTYKAAENWSNYASQIYPIE